MIPKDQITIVLPTLNEEEAIGMVIKEIKEAGFENILVVDGYSTDKTVEIAKQSGAKVIFQAGKGKAAAIETALHEVKTAYMLVMDCDHTYDPKDIQLLLNHGKRYNMVIGARVNGRENIPFINKVGNWVITKVFNVLLGAGLSDVCSGMYLLRTEKAKDLELNYAGFSVEVEIASQFAVERNVTEVPISFRKRIGKQKLSRWKDGFKILYTVFNLARKYNPAFLFSSLAALTSIPATIILIWVMIENLVYGVWHSGYALFGVMLFLLASQGLTVATISILLKAVERRVMNELKRK